MRPGLNRDLVRERTAYKLGRSLVDGFLIAHFILVVIAAVGIAFNWTLDFGLEQPRWMHSLLLVGAICLAVLWGAFAVMFRELAQAFFDIADRALLGAATSALEENPFKQAG